MLCGIAYSYASIKHSNISRKTWLYKIDKYKYTYVYVCAEDFKKNFIKNLRISIFQFYN